MSNAQILIVEDEQIIALDIRHTLEACDYVVVGQTDKGDDAILKTAELRPNLVLMDIGLKGEMDGIEAATQIRARFDLPVIFLTAFANQSTLERARQAEPYGYILKPFNERELISNIEMALYKHNMERKLRESENKFRKVIQHSADGIVLIDSQGILVEWNPAIEEISGLRRVSAIGQPISEVVFRMLPEETRTPAVLERVRQQWSHIINNKYSNGLSRNTEHEIETPQGARKIVQSSGFAIETDKGWLAGATFSDITKRKQAEEAVANSENRFRALIENGRDNISLLAIDGTLLWESPSTIQTLGFAKNQFVGRNIFELMHPDDQDWTGDMFKQVAQQPGSSQEGEFRLRHGDGSWRWIEATATNLLHEPSVQAIVINYRDITERRQAEEALKHNRDLLIALSHSAQSVQQARAIKEIYQAAGEQMKSLGFEASVLTFDDDHKHMSINYTTFAPQVIHTTEKLVGISRENFRLPFLQESTFGGIITTGKPQFFDQIDDLISEALPKFLHPLAEQVKRILKIEQIIIAPLRVGKEALGIFTIGGSGLSKEDLPAVETFAAQVAISLRNAKLTQQLQAELAERRRAEIELTKLSRAVEQSANSIIVTDIEGNIEYANPKFAETSGYSLQEVLKKNPRILRSGIHPREFYQVLWQTIKSGEIWHGEFRNKRKDGTLYWEDTTIAPVFDSASKMTNFIAIKEDITFRKTLELAERDQHRLAEALRDTAMTLNSTLKLDDILDRILANIGKLVKYDAAMVSLIEGGTIRKIRYHSNPRNRSNTLPIRDMQANLLNIPIIKTILETRQPQLIPDIQKDIRWQAVAIQGMQPIRALLCVPIEIRGNITGIINVISATPDFFNAVHTQRIMAFASQAAIAIENAQLYEQAKRLSMTDPLTDLFNMRYFNDVAMIEFERVRRYERTLSIAMVDIDHFKNINDTYGHATGDLALNEIATRMKSAVRNVDVIARYGGEEFVILMPETCLGDARQVAERVRRIVAESPIKSGDLPISATLSLGVTEMDKNIESLDEIVKHADKALYEAKANGRNRVECYSKIG